ncbi:MAG: mechanosensitive ion channel family protein [Methanomassiliicoccus sp.]|nr:mechanosensitive ion channel family protein [Methanomassiliicoccus sp.]
MRKSVVLSFLSIMLIALLLAPSAAAQGINVVDVHEGYDKIDEASHSVSFTWVVYNNDTVPYLIEADADIGVDGSGVAPNDVTVDINQNYTALNPGGSRQVVLTVTADRSASSTDFPVYVNLTLTNLETPTQALEVSKVANVHVTALFESSGNKIFGIWDNTLPEPFGNVWWSFIITVLLWVVIASAIYFIVDPIIHQFTKKTKTDLDDRILEITRMPIFALIVTFGLVDSLAILDISQDWHFTIMQMYEVVVVLVVAYTAFQIFDRVVIFYAQRWATKTDTEIDDVLIPLLQKVGIIVIPLVGVVTVLGILGVDVTLLVAGMGVIGLVVAFAVQETLGNLFAGMQLLLDRPFKVGDIVELESGEICEVRKIGLRSTTMYNTADHEIIVVPNNDVVNKKVVNYSRPDHHRSMNCEIGVAYGTDLNRVKELLLDIAMKHPDVIKQEGQMPYVRLSKFSDSSVDFKLWYWVDIKSMWRVASEVRQAVYDRFNKEGIEIPFPQSVVTVKNGSPTP